MKSELRERAQEVMRAEMVEAAFALVVEHGYDALTADDLARRLGISRATFFRYLGSKDEMIVSAMLGPADQFSDVLRASAGRSVDLTWWARLRAAFEPAAALADASPEQQRERLRMIQSRPALGARLRRARAPQIENLADALIDAGCDPFAGHILASASVAVLDQCWMQWLRDEQTPLRTILDRAFAALEAAGSSA